MENLAYQWRIGKRSLRTERFKSEVLNLIEVSNAGGCVPHVLEHNTDQAENTKTELYLVMEQIDGMQVSTQTKFTRN